MKSSIKFAVAAFALCFFANASATVILQTNTRINKKQVLVQYRHDGTGVLQTMVIKHKRLARWCIKRGGCRTNSLTVGNVPGNGISNEPGSVITSIIETGDNGIRATVPDPEQEVVAVPEPATLALMGAGLLGMGLAARRRKVAA